MAETRYTTIYREEQTVPSGQAPSSQVTSGQLGGAGQLASGQMGLGGGQIPSGQFMSGGQMGAGQFGGQQMGAGQLGGQLGGQQMGAGQLGGQQLGAGQLGGQFPGQFGLSSSQYSAGALGGQFGGFGGGGSSFWFDLLNKLNMVKFQLCNLWDRATNNLDHVAWDVRKGVKQVLHTDQSREQRFRTYFRLPPQEQLLHEVQCAFLSGNTVLEGCAYISYNYFCFAPLITFSKPSSNQMMLITIPFRDMENIQPAVTSDSYIPGVPTIQPLTNPLAKPDACQIITKDHLVYNFFGFIDAMHSFNVLFHAWKSNEIFSSLLQQQQPTILTGGGLMGNPAMGGNIGSNVGMSPNIIRKDTELNK